MLCVFLDMSKKMNDAFPCAKGRLCYDPTTLKVLLSRARTSPTRDSPPNMKSNTNCNTPVVEPDLSQSEAAEQSAGLRRGIMLGLISAVSYSAANLALRGLSRRNGDFAWAVWVTSTKGLPTFIIASIMLIRRYSQGKPLYPTRKPILALVAAGLVMQFGGNLGFQLSLGQIGLAITVPLVFAFIIIAGAVLGKIFLGDHVSPKHMQSMVIMTLSIILLSYAATLKTPGPTESDANIVSGFAWLGILTAVISGMSYGVNGVVIRRIAQKSVPIESMLVIYSFTGLACLGPLGYALMGSERIAEIRTDEWQMMLFAGIFNAIAFFCITHALKLMNISHVNVINASQNAMCALGAVLLFAEPLSAPMAAGILLSICGLVVLDRK